MALTATKSPQGLELLRYTEQREVLHLPGKVSVTFARGDQVDIAAADGAVDIADGGDAGIARVVKTVTTPAATATMNGPGTYDPVAGGTGNDCLVECEINVAAGIPIYLATFSGHADDTVAAYTAATPSLTLTVALGGNDDPNGSIVYVYEGTGAGQVNVITDYVDATKVCTLLHAFGKALSTDSKVIILEGEGGGAAKGLGFLGRTELKDEDEINVDDGTDDGEYLVYMDYRESAKFLKNLTLPIIKRSHLYG